MANCASASLGEGSGSRASAAGSWARCWRRSSLACFWSCSRDGRVMRSPFIRPASARRAERRSRQMIPESSVGSALSRGLEAPDALGSIYYGSVIFWLPTLMTLRIAGLTALMAMQALAQARPAEPNTEQYYQLSPDSLAQEGVPKGEIKGPFTLPSTAYPGTQHTYWIYVPAQYNATVPASLMIYNDGQAFMAPEGDIRAQVVMDNLIYRRELPVMIAVFINPGRRPDQPEPTPANWGDRDTNRPTEYNTLDDKYARVIVDELMPVLYAGYNISSSPERHGIGGSNSGAIAAFTVAWERPDQF